LADGLLVRWIDDWLYISTDQRCCERYLKTMQNDLPAGVPEYGCELNPTKTRTNFTAKIGSQSYAANSSDWIPWCGLLFNSRTFDVRSDYGRYAGTAIDETVAVMYGVPKPGAPRVGDSFRRKLPQYLKPRCQPILLDAQVNSVFTVHLNVYQAFLYCAIKFHANAIALPQPPPANERFFLDCVNDVLLYMHQILEQLRRDPASSAVGFRCPITAAAVNWLGAHAFATILDRKQTRYRAILHALHHFCRAPHRQALATSLNSVVEPRHSTILLNEIRY